MYASILSACACIQLNDSMMGLLTIIAALIGFAVVPHFPAKASFLTEEERQLVKDRINADRGDFVDEKLTVC